MLKATPRNEGAKGIGTSAVPKENHTPTLAQLGLDKKTSSLAQKIASLPPEQLRAVREASTSITASLHNHRAQGTAERSLH